MLCCALTVSAGCSSGGSALAPIGQGPVAAGPTGHDIHVVVEDRAAVTLAVVPAGATIPGVQTRPVPFADIQYPDGSVQIAGADGSFDAAQSAYALRHALLLDNDADAAPYAIVSDPLGRLAPAAAQLGATAAGVPGDQPLNAYVHLLGHLVGHGSLAALAVRPRRISLRAGESAILEATAIDAAGQVESVPGTVRWSKPAAGTIVPLPGTAAARYTAPAQGAGADSVTAAVELPGAAAAYSASVAIEYFGSRDLARVAGTVTENGSPLTGGLAFYQAPALPGYVEGTHWFASAASGAFSVTLPQAARVSPLAKAASGPAFAAALAPGGLRSFVVTSRPLSGVSIVAQSGTPAFVDPGVEAAPPVAAYVRDAWFAPQSVAKKQVFDADSGLQPLLAHAGSPASGTVGAGTFAHWRYAWTRSADGSSSLELSEADAAGRPGRESARIVPRGGGSYAFEQYQAPGQLLTAAGTWKQSSPSSGAFRADVTSLVFTPSHQLAALFARTSTYASDAHGNATLDESVTDASGLPLWISHAQRSPAAAANAGTGATIFSYSATVQRYYRVGVSGADRVEAFAVSGRTGGDGSGTVSYRNATSGVTTAFHVQPGTSTQGLADSGTLTVGASDTPYARFSIDRDDVVTAAVGDGTPAGAASSLAFPL
jgi:hypothetical protein